jgi:type II secretory pathway pseudopilin PulG
LYWISIYKKYGDSYQSRIILVVDPMHKKQKTILILAVILSIVLISGCVSTNDSENKNKTIQQGNGTAQMQTSQANGTGTNATTTGTYSQSNQTSKISGLIRPSDFEYLGAFRLPEDGACGETCSWNYGGAALTYYPAGNPSGSSDGYPGSLFGTGHDFENRISEISIPAPVKSRNIDSLPAATTLQPFANVMEPAFDETEMPVVALAYIPKQGTQNSDKLYGAWGPHLGEGDIGSSHVWFDLNLSNANIKGPWGLVNQTKYTTTGYMFQIPSDWAAANTAGMRLATGRYRDGGQEGQGPSIIAYGPWNQGNPPAAGVVLSNVVLLKYSIISEDETAVRGLQNYSNADSWSGGAWIVRGNKTAVAIVGVSGVGNDWYGFSDGRVCPPSCDGEDRGWWANGFEARILLYDPADLAKVARGQLQSYEPQPYAIYNISGSGALYEPASRQGLGGVAYDQANGLLYIIEPFVDGDTPEYPKPVVHVWRIKN